jgi:hypothetical protein
MVYYYIGTVFLPFALALTFRRVVDNIADWEIVAVHRQLYKRHIVNIICTNIYIYHMVLTTTGQARSLNFSTAFNSLFICLDLTASKPTKDEFIVNNIPAIYYIYSSI